MLFVLTMTAAAWQKECIRIQLAQHNFQLISWPPTQSIRTRRTSIYKSKATMSTPLKKLSLEVMRERRHVSAKPSPRNGGGTAATEQLQGTAQTVLQHICRERMRHLDGLPPFVSARRALVDFEQGRIVRKKER
jgi:hypothetical protein